MAVSLNDLLRLQREQQPPSTGMTLTYVPPPDLLQVTPRAGKGGTAVPGGDAPPQAFAQATDPSDYPRSSLRAQLQVGDPTTPGASMEQMARDWLQWRIAQGEASLEDLSSGGPFGAGGLGGMAKKLVIPPVNVRRLAQRYEQGKDMPQWYAGAPETYAQMYGPWQNLARIYNSILSPQTAPWLAADRSNRAMRLYAEGGLPALQHTPGATTHLKNDLIRATQMWERNPNANLGEALSAESLKRRDYWGAMGGENVSVMDRHLGTAGYPSGFFQSKSDVPRVYLKLQRRHDALADAIGVRRDDYQQAVWQAERLIKGHTTGNEPLREVLITRGQQSPDYQWLLKSGKLVGVSNEGKITLAVALALMGGAGAAGLSETPPQ